jgi:ribonucleoside-diphosphate reductase alpha chain
MTDQSRITYTEAQVKKAALEYFNGDTLAADVWIKKYCLKDENTYYEQSPIDMHHRIAGELARIESKYPNSLTESEIFETLKGFNRIIPAGSPMSGIGNDFQIVSLSNCFVVGNIGQSDSYGGILKVDQEIVQLEKRRGGVGTDVTHIRPVGSPVKNSAITSTGVVPFMERYSNTTKEVAQDGRRGALMISINVKHPDAESFIDAKLTQGKVTGANISVKITDNFMQAIANKHMFRQQFPVDSLIPTTLKLIDPLIIWKKIVHNAWKSAEPGILFWDTIVKESIPDCYKQFGFETISTNPCGEIPLCAYDSCRLLSLNLYGYVENPFQPNARFNHDMFAKDARMAMRYMDDIIDLEIEKINSIIAKINIDPEDKFIKMYEMNLWQEIKKKTIDGRRTGLGVTGMGDMLAALGYRYGTDRANEFATFVQQELKLNAYKSSINMAKERGAFPIYDSSLELNNPFILRIKDEDPALYAEMIAFGRRNIALLTIAPTGSMSILTQTTSGCEPVFLPKYNRRRKINPQEKDARVDFVDPEGISWSEYPVFHHKFVTWLEANKYDMEKVMTMSPAEIDELVKLSPYYKATSNDVDWVKKVEMQGMLQKHIDHSISVTVNLPADTTEEMVSMVYETAWKVGCKGITVYRDGSRDGVLISETEKKENARLDNFQDTHAPKRPKRVKGEIHRFQNNSEKWIAVIGLIDGRPYEFFTGRLENGLTNMPTNIKECEIVKNIMEVDGFNDENQPIRIKKKRYDIEYIDSDGNKQILTGLSHTFNPAYWNYAKLFSGMLRHGMPLVYLHELIESLNLNDADLNTWKNGVARVIKRYIKDGVKGKGVCLVCGSTHLEYIEGCLTCKGCGSSKCS